MNVSRKDQVPSWFCSTHKTVALGVPLIQIIFGGRTDVGVISLPLLMYHPTQLIVGTLLVPKIERWLAKQPVAASTLGQSSSVGTGVNGGADGKEAEEAVVLLVTKGNLSVEGLLAEARERAARQR